VPHLKFPGEGPTGLGTPSACQAVAPACSALFEVAERPSKLAPGAAVCAVEGPLAASAGSRLAALLLLSGRQSWVTAHLAACSTQRSCRAPALEARPIQSTGLFRSVGGGGWVGQCSALERRGTAPAAIDGEAPRPSKAAARRAWKGSAWKGG